VKHFGDYYAPIYAPVCGQRASAGRGVVVSSIKATTCKRCKAVLRKAQRPQKVRGAI
jgi:hypothetical protein